MNGTPIPEKETLKSLAEQAGPIGVKPCPFFVAAVLTTLGPAHPGQNPNMEYCQCMEEACPVWHKTTEQIPIPYNHPTSGIDEDEGNGYCGFRGK